VQLSFLDGEEFEYTYFVTNIEMSSEKVVIAYEKRGNAEKTIKEAKYDMVVSHLLLQSFWVNKAIFQLMMLAYFFCSRQILQIKQNTGSRSRQSN